jgi:hypothetical protein
MFRFHNSFIGFFDTVSDVMKTIGKEWQDYAFTNQDKIAHSWGAAFINASKSLDVIVVDLQRIKDEHDARITKTTRTGTVITAKSSEI